MQFVTSFLSRAVNDPESQAAFEDSIKSFSWSDISVRVPLKGSSEGKLLLRDIYGSAKPGELVALMGPSGSGKTTLLNVLADRPVAPKAKITGQRFVNNTPVARDTLRRLGCYVEQEDHLIGSLTVRETLHFAARLSMPTLSASERNIRVENLLADFGLVNQANTIVGTPLRKGLSGGQKRRLGVAAQLITNPRMLFLDEPTSGLDYVASHEVVSCLQKVAREKKILIVASIHQPSTGTFQLFNRVILLSRGRLCYGGLVSSIEHYFDKIGYPLPTYVNPSEFMLELVNVDFAQDPREAEHRLTRIVDSWSDRMETESCKIIGETLGGARYPPGTAFPVVVPPPTPKLAALMIPFILLHRNFIKSHRDVVAYGVRLFMYLGLAILMGTVWLRLSQDQSTIQPRINAIFFGSAFMSFMAVAYVPSFLEDRSTFVKERANGLYGAGSFMIANFFIGLPYLFLITLVFSSITFWLCNFHASLYGFLTYILWLFLDLVAAESLVVLVSSLFPVFVIALAMTASMNALWMTTSGCLVSPKVINVFWRYWARQINYQAWVFQGMMVNEFAPSIYQCGNECKCMFETALGAPPQCQIAGESVLSTFDYSPHASISKGTGVLVAIIVVYRLLAFAVLSLRKK